MQYALQADLGEYEDKDFPCRYRRHHDPQCLSNDCSTTSLRSEIKMQMPLDDSMPEYARNGGVLQNGYRLQHYHYGGNASAEANRRFEERLANASDAEFQRVVESAREMISDPQLRCMHRKQRRNAKQMGQAGFPYCPDQAELLATGDSRYVIERMDQAREERRAARERFDPGGRNEERRLELRDKQETEEIRRRM